MHYVEYWGGWVPWPAQLYDNQVNPQVTGADGHFAFFTPPGRYYLQVEYAAGYQTWRSPVIEVVDEVVHMNVPLTPTSTAESAVITLTSNGPLPADLTIPRGTTVTWQSELSGVLPLDQIVELIQSPIQRALSSLNPESGKQSWDSGMLVPGRTYTRRFTIPGTYTYSDGDGHTGSITVPYQVFLPTVHK